MSLPEKRAQAIDPNSRMYAPNASSPSRSAATSMGLRSTASKSVNLVGSR